MPRLLHLSTMSTIFSQIIVFDPTLESTDAQLEPSTRSPWRPGIRSSSSNNQPLFGAWRSPPGVFDFLSRIPRIHSNRLKSGLNWWKQSQFLDSAGWSRRLRSLYSLLGYGIHAAGVVEKWSLRQWTRFGRVSFKFEKRTKGSSAAESVEINVLQLK